jgi:hypothetical protein
LCGQHTRSVVDCVCVYASINALMIGGSWRVEALYYLDLIQRHL